MQTGLIQLIHISGFGTLRPDQQHPSCHSSKRHDHASIVHQLPISDSISIGFQAIDCNHGLQSPRYSQKNQKGRVMLQRQL